MRLYSMVNSWRFSGPRIKFADRIIRVLSERNVFDLAYGYNENVYDEYSFNSFISLTKQFFTFHSNRVKCEKILCPRW